MLVIYKFYDQLILFSLFCKIKYHFRLSIKLKVILKTLILHIKKTDCKIKINYLKLFIVYILNK